MTNILYTHCRYEQRGNIMRTNIQKWGNSLALRIPKSFADEINLKQGSVVEISPIDGKLIILPIKNEYTLESLLSGINENNIHNEVDNGSSVGKEIL